MQSLTIGNFVLLYLANNNYFFAKRDAIFPFFSGIFQGSIINARRRASISLHIPEYQKLELFYIQDCARQDGNKLKTCKQKSKGTQTFYNILYVLKNIDYVNLSIPEQNIYNYIHRLFTVGPSGPQVSDFYIRQGIPTMLPPVLGTLLVRALLVSKTTTTTTTTLFCPHRDSPPFSPLLPFHLNLLLLLVTTWVLSGGLLHFLVVIMY